MGRRGPGSALVATIAGLCAPSAEGSTTIGSNLTVDPTVSYNLIGTLASRTMAPATTAPGGITAASPGVITSWAVRSGPGASPISTVRLRVLVGDTATATGRVHPAPPTAGVWTYPERLPIPTAGNVGVELGSTTGATPGAPIFFFSTPAATVTQWNGPFADGATRPPTQTSPGFTVALQATIEPDVDADGFGDETQDGCPGDPGPRGGCPDPPIAPETTIDSGPSGKVKKPKASFTFSSPSAGATFECALDKGGFDTCASPRKLKKLAEGKHRFRVRAVSAAGLIDRTPAERTFKVKPPRK